MSGKKFEGQVVTPTMEKVMNILRRRRLNNEMSVHTSLFNYRTVSCLRKRGFVDYGVGRIGLSLRGKRFFGYEGD